jgi:hypothetical protein
MIAVEPEYEWVCVAGLVVFRDKETVREVQLWGWVLEWAGGGICCGIVEVPSVSKRRGVMALGWQVVV